MDITRHSLERYCERVLGMSNADIPAHILADGEHTKKLILDDFSSARYVITAPYHTNRPARFYVNNANVCFVLSDDNNDVLLTLFNVDYGFDEDMNHTITNRLMIDLLNMEDQIVNLKSEIGPQIHKIESEIIQTDAVIASMERQLTILRAERANKSAAIDELNGKIPMIREKMNQLAYKICYSINYKVDSLIGKKGSK